MKNHSSRRSFLRKTAAASLSVPFVKSLEEYALAAQAAGGPPQEAGSLDKLQSGATSPPTHTASTASSVAKLS